MEHLSPFPNTTHILPRPSLFSSIPLQVHFYQQKHQQQQQKQVLFVVVALCVCVCVEQVQLENNFCTAQEERWLEYKLVCFLFASLAFLPQFMDGHSSIDIG